MRLIANRILFVLLVLATLTSAFAEAPRETATRLWLSSCPEAKPIVLAFFTEHGFAQTPAHSCPDCFEFTSDNVQDVTGHKISARKVIQDYVETATQEKRPFGVWTSYSKPLAKADLRLTSSSGGCLASVLFNYTWNITEVVGAIPKDADAESRPSNRRLERQYLDAMTVRVMHAP